MRLPAARLALRCALGCLAAATSLSACGKGSYEPLPGAHDSAAAAAAAANPVTVSPLPDTEDASPTTQISFLGKPGTRVLDVRVMGSRSGPHAGILRPYSTGTGESFLPRQPFLAGERVTVRARVLASGLSAVARTSFTVASQAPVSEQLFPNNAGDPAAVQHYVSAPELTPSQVTITTPARAGASGGYLFMAPYQGAGTPGLMIARQDGSLVWFHPLPAGEAATNFDVQSYLGKRVLSWWQGHVLQLGFGQGEAELYDSSCRHVATVRAGNGYSADLHELRLTPQGTAWIDAFDPIEMRLSQYGDSQGLLSDSVVQEIDVRTGLVMWEWHALGHIPLAESQNPLPAGSYPWDYVHINSIDPGPAHDVLLSARNTWTVYDVDIHSGAVRWRIGGSQSSFRTAAGARFYWQHDAQFQRGGLISLFDNGSTPAEERQSRGLLLRLDPGGRRVTLVKQFVNPATRLLAESQGNLTALPGGNWLIGYGRLPNFTEFDAAGRVVLDGALGKDVQDFKTYIAPWRGTPGTPPSAVVQRSANGVTTVFASWNGATDVAAWRLLAAAPHHELKAIATQTASGFQTAIAVRSGAGELAVQALDSAGAVIGRSATLSA